MEPDSIYKSDAARAAIEALYDRALARLPFPTASRRVETTFGSTHVWSPGRRCAAAPRARGWQRRQPAHAGVADTTCWRVPHLRTDTIGQPGKSSGRRVSANDASLGEWCEQVLDGLGLGRPRSSPFRTARASCSALPRFGRRGSGGRRSWSRPGSPTCRSVRCLRSPRATSPSWRSGGRGSSRLRSAARRAEPGSACRGVDRARLPRDAARHRDAA